MEKKLLRGNLCSIINQGKFLKIKNEDLFLIKSNKKGKNDDRIQESKFREKHIKEIDKKFEKIFNNNNKK